MDGELATLVDTRPHRKERARRFDNEKIAYMDYLARILDKRIADVIIT